MTGAARVRGGVGVRRRVVVAGVVALALLAAGCSSDESDRPEDAGPGTSAPPAVNGAPIFVEDPTFTEGDCWWGQPEGLPEDLTITCGSIEVPADRADPDSDLLTLAVARYHRDGADAEAPPLVFLHGGPGGSSLTNPPTAGSLPIDGLASRDMIQFDQRGSGRSTPSLDCPEKEEATLDALATAGTWDEEFPAIEASMQACRDRLEGDGIDLGDYDTLAAVADLESIRLAFALDTWHVAGRSYGTRLGLAYARAHPDAVETLLLDSVYGTDVVTVERNLGLPDRAIAALTEACDAQPTCLAANGHVSEELAKAVAAFDADPEVTSGTVTVGGEDQERDFAFTGADLKGGMFAAQYDEAFLPALPGIIHGLATGDRSIVGAFISTGVPGLLDISEGAFASFECADSGRSLGPDGYEAMRADPGDDALYAIGTAEPFCAVWDVEQLPASFNEPVVVDVPTLVFAGTLDPITPYAESKAQAERLPDARLVTVTGGGHGDQYVNDCTRSAATAFWLDPQADLPACTDAIDLGPFT